MINRNFPSPSGPYDDVLPSRAGWRIVLEIVVRVKRGLEGDFAGGDDRDPAYPSKAHPQEIQAVGRTRRTGREDPRNPYKVFIRNAWIGRMQRGGIPRRDLLSIPRSCPGLLRALNRSAWRVVSSRRGRSVERPRFQTCFLVRSRRRWVQGACFKAPVALGRSDRSRTPA